jgi:hypothetical protein
MRSATKTVVSRKISASGLKLMSVPVPVALPMTVAGHLDLEPLGDGVDALGADAVGAAGELVAALAVFAAGVERGHHELDAGQAAVLVDVDRDAAAVVADADGAVDVDRDVDLGAVAGEMLVDRVVEHLGNAVVQGAFIGAADIHARLLADRLEALELPEFIGVVGLGTGVGIRVGRGFDWVGHSVQKFRSKRSRNTKFWTTFF